jgi:MoaA/NifB/PqqE/SkfB family radical SAM enzyme
VASPTGIAPVLQVHPLDRCNLACAHCYTASGPNAGRSLQAALLCNAIDDAAALGYRQLAVSGGEPLLYDALPALLRRARERGLTTTLTTNGLLATAARWSALAPWLDLAAVSIDGRPDEHDELRGRRGAFEQTRRHLAVLRAHSTPFGLIFTLTRHNVDSLQFVVELAAAEGASSVQVHPLGETGRAAGTMPGQTPDAQELLAALAEARWLAHRLGVAVQVDALGPGQLRGWRHHLVPQAPVRDLPQLAPLLVVRADGEVLPFAHEVDARLSLGNLHVARLGPLARAWLDGRSPVELYRAIARTWDELAAAADEPPPVDWFAEVARRTGRRTVPLQAVG